MENKIECTTNYDMFKLLECNRDLKEPHIRKLVMSIQMNNLLHMRPIMVNQKMEVVDGQNRLEAARRLQVPIYYMIDKSLSNSDLINLNNTSLPWDNLDYFKHYYTQGYPEYVKIQDLANKLNINVHEIIYELIRLKNQGPEFKTGKFKMPDLETMYNLYGKTYKVIDHIKTQVPVEKRGYINNRTFKRALLLFLQREDVDFELFLNKLNLNLGKMRRASTLSEYQELFIHIYNYRNSNPIGLE